MYLLKSYSIMLKQIQIYWRKHFNTINNLIATGIFLTLIKCVLDMPMQFSVLCWAIIWDQQTFWNDAFQEWIEK